MVCLNLYHKYLLLLHMKKHKISQNVMRIKIVVLIKQCKAQIQIQSPINLLPIGLRRVPNNTQKTRGCLMK